MFVKIVKSDYFKAFVVGGVGALSFAPFNFFLAAIFSFCALYFLLEKVDYDSKQTFWLGFFFGFGYFLAGIYWIAISLLVDVVKFAWLIPFALSLIPSALAFYVAFTCLIYQKICKRFNFEEEYQKIIIFAIIFTVLEILRCYLFTGFAWNLLGYSLFFDEYFVQSANIFGVYGLGFFALLFAFSPVLLIRKTKANLLFFSFLAFLFVVNFIYGFSFIKNNKLVEKSEEIRIVQGNIKQDLKWNPRKKFMNFKKHIDISNFESKNGLKVIIWPETAVPYAVGLDKNLNKMLADVATKDSFLVTGALRLEIGKNIYDVKKAYNSVFFVDEKAQMKHYDKHHLVPFGEYVPLQKFFPFIKKITAGGDGFSSGKGPKTIEMKGLKISPLLCYEVIFPDKIIDEKNRPDLLVNVTNDAWFGVSSGPFQHLNMARMRAIEYGISLARAANSGVSAYISPTGEVVRKIGLNKTGFFDVKLIKPLKVTIFSQFKYFVILLIMSLFVLFLAIVKIITNKHRKK